MSHRDSQWVEYEDLKKQLKGISPKLSIYTSIEMRIDELRKQLGGIKTLSPVDKSKTVVQ